ncbi:MAG: hypothetical protein J5940_04250 [Clostridia bacterium]|nr:hypothetical protein [Clostridia bacterium]
MILISVFISALFACANVFLRKRKPRLRDFVLASLVNAGVVVCALILVYNGAGGLMKVSAGRAVVSVSTAAVIEAVRLAAHFVKAKRLVLPVCAIISLLAALFAELVVCNFRYFLSEGYEEQTVEAAKYGSGLRKEETGWSIQSENTATVEFRKLDCEIKTIYVDLKGYDKDGTEYSVRVTVYADDEANRTVRKLQSVDVLGSLEGTKYIKMALSGKSTTFRLQFSSKGEIIEIGTVAINVREPYGVSVIRLLAFFLLALIISLIRPKSPLYEYKMSGSGLVVRSAAALVAVLVFTGLLATAAANADFKSNKVSHHDQYAELADSFINGKLWLDKEVPEELINMENPYDRNERDKVMREAGKSAAWDTAYYDGHYYVYFGAVPVIMTFLPYKLLTGSDLHCAASAMFFMFFAVFGVFALLKALIDRYMNRDRVSLLTYLLVASAVTVGGGFAYLAQIPDLYAIPIVSGAAFTLWGLYFWLSAEKNGRMRWYFLLPGSLCMALVAGCRPQMLAYYLVALPVFVPAIFKRRTLFSKKSAAATASLIMPIVAVAALVMAYNYARFGSPFDFGANYNLTTNDMTRRGFESGRIGLGLFTYIFQLPKPISVFPFIRSSDMDTHFMGTTTYETIYGGVVATTPLVWALLLLFRMKKRAVDKTPLLMASAICAAALAIIVFDTECAGLLSRYFSDFRFMLCIAAAIPLFFFEGDALTEERGDVLAVRGFAAFAFVSVLLFEFLMLFMRGSMRFSAEPNTVFVTFEHYMEFWS